MAPLAYTADAVCRYLDISRDQLEELIFWRVLKPIFFDNHGLRIPARGRAPAARRAAHPPLSTIAQEAQNMIALEHAVPSGANGRSGSLPKKSKHDSARALKTEWQRPKRLPPPPRPSGQVMFTIGQDLYDYIVAMAKTNAEQFAASRKRLQRIEGLIEDLLKSLLKTQSDAAIPKDAIPTREFAQRLSISQHTVHR
jgi:hypothetical protein